MGEFRRERECTISDHVALVISKAIDSDSNGSPAVRVAPRPYPAIRAQRVIVRVGAPIIWDAGPGRMSCGPPGTGTKVVES